MCADVDGATFALKFSPGLSCNFAASCVMIDCKAVGWPFIYEYLGSWAELCRSRNVGWLHTSARAACACVWLLVGGGLLWLLCDRREW
jgi:hypothetical protein